MMMTERTDAQKWALRRNFLKMRMMGARAALSQRNPLLTKEEKYKIAFADKYLRELLESWDDNNAESKRIYLAEIKRGRII